LFRTQPGPAFSPCIGSSGIHPQIQWHIPRPSPLLNHLPHPVLYPTQGKVLAAGGSCGGSQTPLPTPGPALRRLASMGVDFNSSCMAVCPMGYSMGVFEGNFFLCPQGILCALVCTVVVFFLITSEFSQKYSNIFFGSNLSK